jgi:hypothetical protein
LVLADLPFNGFSFSNFLFSFRMMLGWCEADASSAPEQLAKE